jgi:transcriptional regulator with XRE-family HTH domain
MQHENNICKKFGEHLKNLREAKNLSLNMLAYENDLNKSTLSRIENGIVDPKLSTLNKIAESLELSLEELMKF